MELLQRSIVLLVLTRSVTEGVRIIGGQEVEPYSIKYQASVQTENGQHYCGGTLVHSQWVVSAAHCWRQPSQMRVVLSEHSLTEDEGYEQVFNVSKIIMHDLYSGRTYNNDIMLIKLSEPAQLNQYVEPAVLPSDSTFLRYGDTCTVSGWGVTKINSRYLSPELHAVDVNIMPFCNYYYYYYWGRITVNMLCAGSYRGGKDSCQGDSGGPLICNGYFEGLVSWGISCAISYYPGVYTRIKNYVTWIQWKIDSDTP